MHAQWHSANSHPGTDSRTPFTMLMRMPPPCINIGSRSILTCPQLLPNTETRLITLKHPETPDSLEFFLKGRTLFQIPPDFPGPLLPESPTTISAPPRTTAEGATCTIPTSSLPSVTRSATLHLSGRRQGGTLPANLVAQYLKGKTSPRSAAPDLGGYLKST